jgi:HPt (histidine-containing phosphotransfer) domain-containing protein
MSAMTEGRGNAVFDQEVLLTYVGGDRGSMLEIVRLVMEEAPRWLAQASDAVHSRLPQQVFLAGHTMTGTLSTIGAAAAAGVAVRLEAMGKRADLSGAPEALEELERAMGDLACALRREFSE